MRPQPEIERRESVFTMNTRNSFLDRVRGKALQVPYVLANSGGQNEQQADLQETFHSSSITQELGGYLWNYVSLSFCWLGMAATQWFQGWHKDFSLGKRITKTIVINVGSKERDNEESPRSFDNDVSFEVDDWKEIEEYSLRGFNPEDELPQDEWKSAAIPTKNPSVKPSAIPQEKPSAKPVAIPHEKPSTIPPKDGKNDDDIAEDKKKPAANWQEEMLTTEVTAQSIQYTIPSLPAIAGNLVTWICEFCDAQWPQSQKRCGSCKIWKGCKRSIPKKRTIRNILCLRTRRRKGVGKLKCRLLFQPRRLIFLW
jgi:hypothetical protein